MSRSCTARHVGTAAAALLVVLAVALTSFPTPAAAHHERDFMRTVDLTMPVAGAATFTDDYHAWRGGGTRRHQATDLMAPHRQPVHAAMGGRVSFITGMADNPPSSGYMIVIAGDDGLRYSYIHLGRQHGTAAQAYAPGMARDVRVERGQHIGYVGDSGNATGGAPHLHFEISDPHLDDPALSHASYRDKRRLNPHPSLVAARARGDVPDVPAGGVAVVGDWNGDGRATPGVFKDGIFYLRNAHAPGRADHVVSLGQTGDVPVVGDWNGNGRDGVGVFRDVGGTGTWILRSTLSHGGADLRTAYGRGTDRPVVGDWNGDGRDTPGVVRTRGSTIRWMVRGGLTSGGTTSFDYGRPSDQPVVGDWSGDGLDTPGVFRDGRWILRRGLSSGSTTAFTAGAAGDAALLGDWNGNGQATPALFNDGAWRGRNTLRTGKADFTYRLG